MKLITSFAILILAAFAGVIAQGFVKKSMHQSRGTSTQEILANVAKEINKYTPSQVDENTRLMNAVAIGTTLRYRYTLANVSHKNFLQGSIGAEHGDRLHSNVCSTEGMRPLVKLKAVLEYAYYDKDGAELEVVPIDTATCQ